MKEIAGGVTATQGFEAAGVAAGIRKHNKKKDLALLYSVHPAQAAGVFTTNVFAAAPVLFCRKVLKGGSARAVVINSGCANACTGEKGYQDTEKMAALTAEALQISPQEVFVASTGVIGEYLPMPKVEKGIPQVVKSLSPQGGSDAAEAILTTDTVTKEFACQVELTGGTVTLGGMTKGSGMIHPNMATMLAYLTTDAAIEGELLQQALKEAVEVSFNMISVDGDTSTNDMVVLLANSQADNAPIKEEGEDYQTFLAALTWACTELAKKIVQDGEGATKLIEVTLKGCATSAAAKTLARNVLNSNLVKTAFFGEDANWGRIVTALGNSGVAFDPAKVDIYLGDMQVASAGRGVFLDEERAKKILEKGHIPVTIQMGMGQEEAVAWGCDLSYDYVKINGSYRT